MTQNLPSLTKFARLNRQSSKKDVHLAVVNVIRELHGNLMHNPDLGLARGSLSQILKFLHELSKTVHPGRIALSQAIGNDLLKILYNPPFKQAEKESGAYKYKDAEKILLDYVSETYRKNLKFLSGNDPLHRAYGKERLDLGIAPFCIFAPEFADGIIDAVTLFIKYRLRRREIEQALYIPITEDFVKKGKDPKIFLTMRPQLIVDTLKENFIWAQKKFCLIPQDQDIQFEKTYHNEKEAYSFEEMLCIEILDKLLIHSLHNNYFLPSCIDFMFLNSLFGLDKNKVNKGYEIIAHAIKMGEDRSYIIHRIDSLDRSHTQHLFDFALLSAYYFGDDFGRLPYRFIHDACLGGANKRETIETNRPMLSAEVCRRPTQLAGKLVRITESDKSDETEIYNIAVSYMVTVAQLNAIRFNKELVASLGLFITSDILGNLVKWLESPERAKHTEIDSADIRFTPDAAILEIATEIVNLWKKKFNK